MSKKLDSEFKMFSYVRTFLTSYLPEIRNYSDSTVKLYRFTLNAFFEYIAKEKRIGFKKMDFSDLSESNIKDFLLYTKKMNGCSARTCNTYLASLRSFVHYCVLRDSTLANIEIEVNSIPRMKEEVDLSVKHFSKNALLALLSVPDRKTWLGRRNYLIMFLLYDTGCRISEILGMTLDDFHGESNNKYITVQGKGGKIRNVPICKQSAILLNSYIDELNCNGRKGQLLFFGKDGYTRLTTCTCERMIKNAGKTAAKKCKEIPPVVTPHMFRHSRALHLYEDGVPLTVVQQLLGHSSLDTTYIYAYASTEMKKQAIDKATNENSMLNKMKIKREATSPLRNKDEFKKYFGLKLSEY